MTCRNSEQAHLIPKLLDYEAVEEKGELYSMLILQGEGGGGDALVGFVRNTVVPVTRARQGRLTPAPGRAVTVLT